MCTADLTRNLVAELRFKAEFDSALGLIYAAKTSGEADWYQKNGVLIYVTEPNRVAHALSGCGYTTGPASQEGFLRVYWSK